MSENVLIKRDDETEFEYHKRLIYGKLKDKTLSDYDYAEMSPYIYGKQYTADETRKRMYGSVKTLEILDEAAINNITDDDLIAEINSKKIDLQKEKQRFFDQRREFNKLVNSEGRMEHLFGMLENAANKLPETVGRLLCDGTCECKPNNYSDNEAVLVLSDWHYGMVASNIWNEFDIDICRYRISSVIKNAIERIRLHKCRTAHIVLLGDFIHGHIHCSTRVASEELVCDQLMQVSELLAQAILEISKHVETVEVYSTFGNHGRVVANKKDNIHMDNLERIIPWWLERRIQSEYALSSAEPNVHVNTEDGYELLLFNVCNHGFCAAHGDLDAVKTSPRLLTSLLLKTQSFELDYVLLGDKHHTESFEELGVESILCGSLCGTDEYANNKRLYSSPSQLLLIVNKDDGVDARYRINCERH